MTTAPTTRGYHNPNSTDEWGTPSALFARLDDEFGFGLDLAATLENRKCSRWFGTQRDGTFVDSLIQSWVTSDGRPAYLNPPYSKIDPWAEKAWAECQAGAFVVMLVPVNSDRVWWQEYAMKASEIRLIRGRLSYEGPQGHNARFPSCVLIYRPWVKATGYPHVWGWDWRTQ